MSIFRRKPSISCQELAGTLAPRFSKLVIALFDEEKETRGKQSWAVKSGESSKCRSDPLKEWVLFSLAGYIYGCQSSMRQDETHFDFVRSFNAACGHDFISHRIFNNEEEFEQIAMDRISDYLSALQEGSTDRTMKLVAQKFLTNVGSEPDDINLRVEAVGLFMNTAIETKKMFDDLQKSYRIVSHA